MAENKKVNSLIKRRETPNIKGRNEFARDLEGEKPETVATEQPNRSTEVEKAEPKTKDPIHLSTKTLKVSEPVLAQIQSLKPIIKDKEGIERSTVNEVINTLVEHYVEHALDDKDKQRYKSVYEVFAPR